jgi:hypothetical protein
VAQRDPFILLAVLPSPDFYLVKIELELSRLTDLDEPDSAQIAAIGFKFREGIHSGPATKVVIAGGSPTPPADNSHSSR